MQYVGMQIGRIHVVSRHVVRQNLGMQLGKIHAVSMHVVRQSFLCTPIFASKMKLKQKGLNWDLNLGPLEPYAKSVDLQVVIMKNILIYVTLK